MAEIPDRPNCFSTIGPELSLDKIAKIFRAAGWEVRKSGWTEYEISCGWAELELVDAPPVLLSGAVADLPARLEEVFAPLVAAGATFAVDDPGRESGG